MFVFGYLQHGMDVLRCHCFKSSSLLMTVLSICFMRTIQKKKKKNVNKASMTEGVPPVYSRLFDLVLCIIVSLRTVLLFSVCVFECVPKWILLKMQTKTWPLYLLTSRFRTLYMSVCFALTKEGKEPNSYSIECELVNKGREKGAGKKKQANA